MRSSLAKARDALSFLASHGMQLPRTIELNVVSRLPAEGPDGRRLLP